jgi:hypothetical protein
MDQFDTFYDNNETGGSSRWMVTPTNVKRWVERLAQDMFKAGQDEAFDRVIDLIGPNMNEDTRIALEFLINEK